MTLTALLRRPSLPLDGLEVLLHQDHPLRLSGARGHRLVCTEGCAWITAPGEPDDIYLFPGDAWEIGCNGLVLVEAVGRAAVALRGRRRTPPA